MAAERPASLSVGLQLPNFGAASSAGGLRHARDLAVEHGLDGLWASDHIVLVDDPKSKYPYSKTGDYVVAPDTEWFEALVTLAALASDDVPLELGTSVCVIALREPVLLAKQLATLDQFCGGRLLLGVGIGWLAEEYEAVGVSFARRGRRTDDMIELLRQCWSGTPARGSIGELHAVPPGVHCEPRPVNTTIPVLVGGNSPAAIARTARVGDGWYGAATRAGFGLADLHRVRGALAAACSAVERDPAALSLSVRSFVSDRALASDDTVELWCALARGGLSRITVDVAWHDRAGAERVSALGALARRVRRSLESERG
jgi:probable F420-dependent oxidoreductase